MRQTKKIDTGETKCVVDMVQTVVQYGLDITRLFFFKIKY